MRGTRKTAMEIFNISLNPRILGTQDGLLHIINRSKQADDPTQLGKQARNPRSAYLLQPSLLKPA
jgi:hypothetical protein